MIHKCSLHVISVCMYTVLHIIYEYLGVYTASRIPFFYIPPQCTRSSHTQPKSNGNSKKSLKLQNIKYSWLIIVYVPWILFISLVLCGSKEIQLNRSMQMIKIHKFLTPKNMFHSSAYTIFYVPERKTKRTGQKKNKMRNIYNPKIKWNFRISLYFSLGAATAPAAAYLYVIRIMFDSVTLDSITIISMSRCALIMVNECEKIGVPLISGSDGNAFKLCTCKFYPEYTAYI